MSLADQVHRLCDELKLASARLRHVVHGQREQELLPRGGASNSRNSVGDKASRVGDQYRVASNALDEAADAMALSAREDHGTLGYSLLDQFLDDIDETAGGSTITQRRSTMEGELGRDNLTNDGIGTRRAWDDIGLDDGVAQQRRRLEAAVLLSGTVRARLQQLQDLVGTLEGAVGSGQGAPALYSRVDQSTGVARRGGGGGVCSRCGAGLNRVAAAVAGWLLCEDCRVPGLVAECGALRYCTAVFESATRQLDRELYCGAAGTSSVTHHEAAVPQARGPAVAASAATRTTGINTTSSQPLGLGVACIAADVQRATIVEASLRQLQQMEAALAHGREQKDSGVVVAGPTTRARHGAEKGASSRQQAASLQQAIDAARSRIQRLRARLATTKDCVVIAQ